MASRKKLTVAVAVGVAGLLLIGLGVRASFTSSVTVTQTISTGDVNLKITDATFQFCSDGCTDPVEVGGAPFPDGVSSVDLGTSDNNGDFIDELYTFTLKNFGSFDANLNCTIAGTSADGEDLNTELRVVDPNPDNDDDGILGTLADVEELGVNVCTLDSFIGAGQTGTVTLEIVANLGDDAMGETVSPTLTIVGTEATSAP